MTTLLAVDDSNTMRKVLEITFAGEDDLEVVLAAGANEALGHANERRPTLALVDVTLSGTDGYALCQQLKRETQGIRVILLSSKQNPYDPSRGAASGADDHIDKPFDTQTLIDRVRALLETAPLPIVASPQLEIIEEDSAVPESPYRPEPPYQPPPQQAPVHLQPVYPSPPPQASSPAVMSAATVRPDDAVRPAAAKPALAVTPTSPPPVSSKASSQIKAAATNGTGALNGRLEALGLTPEQVAGVLSLSREVIEQAVWEVVPVLAETLIKEEIARLTND